MKTRWTVGTRGSKLALKQTNMVIDALQSHYPGYEFTIKTIKTTGDAVWDKSLQSIGEKGLFVKEIEQELQSGAIDMAVHSMKDVPTDLADGLLIGATLKREDPRDAFISFTLERFDEIGVGSRIGTNSVRRQSQILDIKRGVIVVPIRGNVDTRIRKVQTLGLDGIILAVAGVKRMGLERYVKDILPMTIMVPPSGQGAIGIEVRRNDEASDLIGPINDGASLQEVSIERRFQTLFGGGCSVPLGVNATVAGNSVTLRVAYGDENGTSLRRIEETGPLDHVEDLIRRILEKLSIFKDICS